MTSPSILWMASSPRSEIMTRTQKMGGRSASSSMGALWTALVATAALLLADKLPPVA